MDEIENKVVGQEVKQKGIRKLGSLNKIKELLRNKENGMRSKEILRCFELDQRKNISVILSMYNIKSKSKMVNKCFIKNDNGYIVLVNKDG